MKIEIIKSADNNPVAEFFSSSSTPETDKFKIKLKTTCGEKYWVPVEHSERMERERDDALSQIFQAEGRSEMFCQERDEAREECNQQARLLGISGERELSLRGKIFELERKIQQLEEK